MRRLVGNRVFLWGNAEPSGRLQHAQFDVHAGGGCHVHQRIEAEQVDLAAHQVGDAWLSHAEQ